MAQRFRVGLVQPNIWDDMGTNIAHVSALVRKAREAGADLIATPENSGFMGANAAASVAAGRPEDSHPALQAFRALSKELNTWLLVGSLAIKPEGANRNFNRSYLLAPDGGIAARYDKIHLFDVDLPSGETYRESNSIAPGSEGVLAPLPFATLGMSICYDLRFPGLYRGLAQAGADIISIPAAFTRTTGQAHWHVLLRARAIETGAFVIAPAMWGDHPGNRQTYGHSLVIDPWGRVLADAGDGVGVVTAEIDLAQVAKARGQIPAWRHDPAYSLPARAAE
ncbi:carbon-nitrogen hydrolase family protein [Ferrovibrio sp.]|uniref:carbon-nitrogen hydrolase family protein n=1 Tax=Ferrovibrio sp. TaxID=1917215 RepID=UPI00261625F7|nr:carbon-nitrogen hydrolase family protein [Ferrovibrio sp.]